MNIVVVGSGYVGLVTGACFAEMGNHVTCLDIDAKKIDNLNNEIIPIYEPGLKAMVVKNLQNKNLHFSADPSKSIQNTEIIFIAVGTPMLADGSADLQNVLSVAKSIGQTITKRLIVVTKSTVPVGTTDKVREIIQNELNERNSSISFDVVSNPEFLKQGAAVGDFMKPDRVIIGAESEYAIEKMKEVYSSFFRTNDRFIVMDIRSAEMTKYAANAILATKISFINEISTICELVQANINSVRIGIGSDSRIGYNFIYPGCGYGGSCFPKDVNALKKIAQENGYDAELISAVQSVNDKQKLVIADKVIQKFGEDLSGKIFGIWGLAFKPGTDDMREAPAIYIIQKLIEKGATIKAYDSKAMEKAKTHYLKALSGSIEYVNSKYDALNHADAMILLTEWKEFRSPDFEEIKLRLKSPIIFDGRNQYNAFNLDKKGIEYIQIGVKQ